MCHLSVPSEWCTQWGTEWCSECAICVTFVRAQSGAYVLSPAAGQHCGFGGQIVAKGTRSVELVAANPALSVGEVVPNDDDGINCFLTDLIQLQGWLSLTATLPAHTTILTAHTHCHTHCSYSLPYYQTGCTYLLPHSLD